MKDEEIKNILKSKCLKEPEFEWTKIKGRINSEDKKLKLSLVGAFLTVFVVVTLNTYNYNDPTNTEDIINYMLEDNYQTDDYLYGHFELL